MAKCEHFKVTGRVQGVGFRVATQAAAQRFGLIGWVRNTSDGGVEVLASGPPEALELLADWLQRGPDLARVEVVERKTWTGSDDHDDSFSIRH